MNEPTPQEFSLWLGLIAVHDPEWFMQMLSRP